MEQVWAKSKERRKWRPPEPPDKRVGWLILLVVVIASHYWQATGLISGVLAITGVYWISALLFLYLIQPQIPDTAAGKLVLVALSPILLSAAIWLEILGMYDDIVVVMFGANQQLWGLIKIGIVASSVSSSFMYTAVVLGILGV